MDGYDLKEKSKLTLSLNKDVIQRAKAAGINISEITEKLLTAVTLTPRGNSYDDVAEAYRGFLQSIRGILEKYNAEVILKKEPDPPKHIVWLDEMGLWSAYYNEKEDAPEYQLIENPKEAISLLGDPVKLLENIINSLIEAAVRNKEQIIRLEFALKLVKAFSEEKGDGKD
jgi:hypothetical protein